MLKKFCPKIVPFKR